MRVTRRDSNSRMRIGRAMREAPGASMQLRQTLTIRMMRGWTNLSRGRLATSLRKDVRRAERGFAREVEARLAGGPEDLKEVQIKGSPDPYERAREERGQIDRGETVAVCGNLAVKGYGECHERQSANSCSTCWDLEKGFNWGCEECAGCERCGGHVGSGPCSPSAQGEWFGLCRCRPHGIFAGRVLGPSARASSAAAQRMSIQRQPARRTPRERSRL